MIEAVVARILLALATSTLLSAAASAQDLTAQHRQDLAYLSERLLLIHPAPEESAAKRDFRVRVQDLNPRLDGLDRTTFAIEIARLTALLRDAHTRLLLNSVQPALRAMPIQVRIFSEGVIITATTDAYRTIAGTRLVRIGRLDVSEVMQRLMPLISTENASWIRQAAPQRLVTAEILRYIGAIDNLERVTLRVSSGGAEQDVVVDVLPSGARPQWIDARSGVTPSPLRRRNPARKHWFEALPAARAVYFQYNEVADDGPRTIADLARDLKGEFSTGVYERLMIDLRSNGGGNNLLNRDLLHALIQIPGLRETGRLIVLIGRNTFSAGMMFALDLEYHFNPVFIGEPTGGSPNFFAEPVTITLPNSKLQIFCATAEWQYSDPRDRRVSIPPLISVDPSWADEVSGRDSALDEAFAWTPQPGLTSVLEGALDAGGFERLIDAYRAFVADPRHRWFETEGGLTTLGFRLLRANRIADAVKVFELNALEHPSSAIARANLGNALLRQGAGDRAREEYERARRLDPRNAGILAALESLQSK
jgi:tetratricopeptide (TPR) repeat protein